MELNEEVVKKSLDWLDSLVGNSNDSEIALFTYQLLGILYDTCEKLTEENERLRADNKTVAKRTVRKFVKMLKSHDCRCDSCINEIKKEIENEQGNFV